MAGAYSCEWDDVIVIPKRSEESPRVIRQIPSTGSGQALRCAQDDTLQYARFCGIASAAGLAMTTVGFPHQLSQ